MPLLFACKTPSVFLSLAPLILTKPCERGQVGMIVPILQIRKIGLREVTCFPRARVRNWTGSPQVLILCFFYSLIPWVCFYTHRTR